MLVKESMNVMENNAKSKTVSASKVVNVSSNSRLSHDQGLERELEREKVYFWKRSDPWSRLKKVTKANY